MLGAGIDGNGICVTGPFADAANGTEPCHRLLDIVERPKEKSIAERSLSERYEGLSRRGANVWIQHLGRRWRYAPNGALAGGFWTWSKDRSTYLSRPLSQVLATFAIL